MSLEDKIRKAAEAAKPKLKEAAKIDVKADPYLKRLFDVVLESGFSAFITGGVLALAVYGGYKVARWFV